ncbi:MAG: saccharopine dehydrogenase NADP-binding domain-containing protein [Bacteroidota bacterium]|nr:saccharopine dehydrogenase NADP-binding domain-containing protein [Bacteroidota bacterium]
MKNILLLGAGKSATVLIDYLKDLITKRHWTLTVADANLSMAQAKVGTLPHAQAVQFVAEETEKRQALIKKADIVISMLPPALHYMVALDCIHFKKNLLTASYTDETIKKHATEIKEKELLFLYEMGLDPGIDHMSAMQLIHRIKREGGMITSFASHCGGLIAPESDDNPWHYKISWNPKNIILAGKAGAVYKKNGAIVKVPYESLFNANNLVQTNDGELYAFYPNRDSLQYMPLYGLDDTNSFMRTTLRHPDFSFGWKNIVDLHLTNEAKVYQTDGMSIADFFKLHFKKYGFEDWLNQMLLSRLSFAKEMMEKLAALINAEDEAGDAMDKEMMMVDEEGKLNNVHIDDVKNKAAETAAYQMHEANLGLKQLFFLGMNDDTLINKGLCSAADVLQFILENKLALQPGDKDMIVMLHEIVYELDGDEKKVSSLLKLIGENDIRTAMATTVGLPLGIAAKLILENEIHEKGLLIPTLPSIYEPVLKELTQHGIQFKESNT